MLVLVIAVLALTGYSVYRTKQQVDSVKRWEQMVKDAAEKNGISAYEDVVLAIILTETKGDHLDVMQSSESKYGVRNQITTSAESIESGVAYLAKVIQEAENQGCDVWTAVQAYNFGINYIQYIAENGQTNTVELAESYSRDILSPMLGNTTKETYFHRHPLTLIHNGGQLYKNGGNFLYADTVKLNMKIMSFFSAFQ